MRQKPMYNFMVAGPSSVFMYGYDETVAQKGSNEVISFLYMYATTVCEEARVKDDPIHHLIYWCDGCAGHVWNSYVARFIHEMVTPGSQFYIGGLERIDIKRAITGHSYMWADRAIPAIKAQARKCKEIVSIFDDERLPPKWKGKTWESCIKKAKCGGGNPYRLHKVKPEEIMDFKALADSEDYSLIRTQASWRFLNSNGTKGEVVEMNKMHWMSAGVIDEESLAAAGISSGRLSSSSSSAAGTAAARAAACNARVWARGRSGCAGFEEHHLWLRRWCCALHTVRKKVEGGRQRSRPRIEYRAPTNRGSRTPSKTSCLTQ